MRAPDVELYLINADIRATAERSVESPFTLLRLLRMVLRFAADCEINASLAAFNRAIVKSHI